MYSGWGAWDPDWVWSIGMIAVTVAIHAAGVVSISGTSERFWNAPIRKKFPFSRRWLAIAVIVGVGLSLAILHGFESTLWALTYLHVGALATPAEALLYSLDSMTTRGASGFQLASHWRMMGAIEAMDGMLLFGISTAFLFGVIQKLLISPPRSGEAVDD